MTYWGINALSVINSYVYDHTLTVYLNSIMQYKSTGLNIQP